MATGADGSFSRLPGETIRQPRRWPPFLICDLEAIPVIDDEETRKLGREFLGQ